MIHFKPPLPLFVLLALYWSRQVCIRAFPALSLEYFGEIALGNIALPTGAEVAGGCAAVGLVGAAAGAFALGASGGGGGGGSRGGQAVPQGLRQAWRLPRPRTPLCGSLATSGRRECQMFARLCT